MASRLDLDSPSVRRQLIMTLIQNTPAAYAVLGRDYRIMFLNDFFMQSRKVEGPVPVGETCYNIVNGGEPCPQCAVREAIEGGRPARVLRKDVLADGTTTYSDDFAVPIADPLAGGFDCVLRVMVDRTEEMRLRERNGRIFLDVICSLIGLLEKKDPYTCAHSRNVGAISAKLVRHLGLGPQAAFRAALGGMLHDLGMLFVPDGILEKQAGLSDQEYATVKEHPMFTWLLLAGMASFGPLREIAIAHHERWDGKGYPNGTSGEAIPVEARVTAIADTYDAMTSDRPYRRALSHGEAMAEIGKLAGTQFDPRIVGKFVQMAEEGGMDREALVAASHDVPKGTAADFVLYAHRHGKAGPHGAARRAAGDLDGVMASDPFLESIFNNTPAFYAVIDESFNVLFASESLAAATGKPSAELLSGKCFDMMDKRMRCFQQGGGGILCPAVGAFATGERQYALMEEDIGGQKLYFDNFAVPLELDGADGGKIKCCLEIMFDRTREKNAQCALEGDLRQLIAKMRTMVEDILPEAAAGAREIVREAGSFGECPDNIRAGLSGLSAAREAPIPGISNFWTT